MTWTVLRHALDGDQYVLEIGDKFDDEGRPGVVRAFSWLDDDRWVGLTAEQVAAAQREDARAQIAAEEQSVPQPVPESLPGVGDSL